MHPTLSSLSNQTATTISSTSSIQSLAFANVLVDAKQPQAHLKQLALREVPYHAKESLSAVLDSLESSAADNREQTIDLAKGFVEQFKSEPKVLESLFKYLNCNFMLQYHGEKGVPAQNMDSKAQLRSRISDLKLSSASSAASLQNLLKGPAKMGPVLTSHPTQLNRPESAGNLANYPVQGFDNEQDALNYAEKLWDSAGRRTEKPSVLDEAIAAKPALNNILQSMRKNGKVLIQSAQELSVPTDTPLLEAGNWIAGDRDGNPTITPKLLGEVMQLWSSLAFDQYLHKVSPNNAENRPNCLHNLFQEAGHTEQLNLLRAKLEDTRRHVVDNAPAADTPNRFQNTAELIQHVQNLKNNLDWQQLEPELAATVQQKLGQLELWAKTFGFHGVSTHIRQNSEVNQKTVHALVEAAKPCTNYTELSEDDKVALLTRVLNDDPDLQIPASVSATTPEIQKEIEFLNSYKPLRDRFGEAALPTVITANTETVSDMLEVCVMLKYAGVGQAQGLGMNVMPLIETVPDMKNAKALMEQWLAIPAYKAHLQTTGDVQHVMLGYSDSMRGNGIVSAAWEAHKLPAELKEVAKNEGVKLHFFHGRGGTEARGSRENYADEIAHVDGGSLEAGYTQTEQGEEVFKKFGHRAQSDNNISQLISSTLSTGTKGDDKHIAQHEQAMNTISQHADEAYQTLYQDPMLAEHLQQTTPLPYVGLSNAGSRPASRNANLQGAAFLAKLRAIPYVASWYQSASMAPAYFGLGTGVQRFIDQGEGTPTDRVQTLKKMYREWPFFTNLVDRAESALGKADMDLAQRYAALNPRTESVFNKVAKEHGLSRQMIDLIKGQNTETLPPTTPGLRTFTHAAQIELLRQAKQANDVEKPAIETGVAMSMQAVASALGRFG